MTIKNNWLFVDDKEYERICSVCGKTHKTTCVLRTENGMICTKCLLSESDDLIQQDPLSGTYQFTTNEVSMDDYNNFLDEADEQLTKQGL